MTQSPDKDNNCRPAGPGRCAAGVGVRVRRSQSCSCSSRCVGDKCSALSSSGRIVCRLGTHKRSCFSIKRSTRRLLFHHLCTTQHHSSMRKLQKQEKKSTPTSLLYRFDRPCRIENQSSASQEPGQRPRFESRNSFQRSSSYSDQETWYWRSSNASPCRHCQLPCRQKPFEGEPRTLTGCRSEPSVIIKTL